MILKSGMSDAMLKDLTLHAIVNNMILKRINMKTKLLSTVT